MESIKECTIECNQNVMCRAFDYNAANSQECRLFEGNTNTLGDIVISFSAQLAVGAVHISANDFIEYVRPCTSFCESRYLMCGSSLTCECIKHTYWDQVTSTCLPQSPVFASSYQLNVRCFHWYFVVSKIALTYMTGTTVAGYGNGSSGNDATRIYAHRSIYVSPIDETLYVSVSKNCRVQRFDFE
ncbi:unnamed protein product [Adineta ricciae]|uniref:Apple domain-containing protein n=1 Tax=Adineta ricciae TaxID=249248 RepID=A0A814ML38_ADIRI|nr:unnamed protein product [Adineta ricciae]CAF1080476.1 unnamed protein product [Adineta ricciae]